MHNISKYGNSLFNPTFLQKNIYFGIKYLKLNISIEISSLATFENTTRRGNGFILPNSIFNFVYLLYLKFRWVAGSPPLTNLLYYHG